MSLPVERINILCSSSCSFVLIDVCGWVCFSTVDLDQEKTEKITGLKQRDLTLGTNATHTHPTSMPCGGCKGQHRVLRTQASILQFYKTELTTKQLKQTSDSPTR